MKAEALADVWAAGMVRACVPGTLLILSVWLASRTVLKRSPGLRQAFWWLACLKLLVGAVWYAPVRIEALPAPAVLRPIAFVVERSSPLAETVSPTEAALGRLPWESVLSGLWLVGVAVKGGILVRRGLAARRLLDRAADVGDETLLAELREASARIGLNAPPRLKRSDELTSPCVVGLVRPVLLVPEDFADCYSAEERTMAFAHEAAHLRRGDLGLSGVPILADLFFFFLPSVWLAVREWADEREAACDRAAVAATGVHPKRYGEMLLKLVRNDARSPALGLGASSHFHTVRRRLTAVFQAGQERPSALQRFGVAGFGALLVVPWALAAPTPNYPLNADFETGSNGPANWTAKGEGDGFELAWDGSVARSGTRSLRITRTTDRYWPIAEWSQELPLDPATLDSLEFGASIRADHAYKAVLDVQFEHADGSQSHAWAAFVGERGEGYGPAHHDWATYAGVVAVPRGVRRIRVALQDYGKGAVWMDDAYVRPMTRYAASSMRRP